MAAALRAKPSKETVSLSVSKFRCFVSNYVHAGGMDNSHGRHRTKWDYHFMNTPYYFTSFKPVSLRGDFVEKGTHFFESRKTSQNSGKFFDRNWSQRLSSSGCTIVTSNGEPPEIWSGDGIVNSAGNSSFNDIRGGGEGGDSPGSGGDFGSHSKDGCWGGSNLGSNFPTPKDICALCSSL